MQHTESNHAEYRRAEQKKSQFKAGKHDVKID
jgi:hypothetical protein